MATTSLEDNCQEVPRDEFYLCTNRTSCTGLAMATKLFCISILYLFTFAKSETDSFDSQSDCLEVIFNSANNGKSYHNCEQCECKSRAGQPWDCPEKGKWITGYHPNCVKNEYMMGISSMRCTGSTVMDGMGACVGRFKVIAPDGDIDYDFGYAPDKQDCLHPNDDPSNLDLYCDFPAFYESEQNCLEVISYRNHPGDYGHRVSDLHCQKCQCKNEDCKENGQWVLVNEHLSWHHTGNCKQVAIPQVEMRCIGTTAFKDGVGRCIDSKINGYRKEFFYASGMTEIPDTTEPSFSPKNSELNVTGGSNHNKFNLIFLILLLIVSNYNF